MHREKAECSQGSQTEINLPMFTSYIKFTADKNTSGSTDDRESASRLLIVQKEQITLQHTEALSQLSSKMCNCGNTVIKWLHRQPSTLASCQPTRWASYQGTTCGPGAWTPRCGSAPCCSCCPGSTPPPWLTAESACPRTSSQTPQSHCRSLHTRQARWPSSFCSVRRYGSAPRPGARGHWRTPPAPPAEGSSVRCGPASLCWRPGQSTGGWRESPHRRRAQTPPHRGRSTWRCWPWANAGPKPPSCFFWWCESVSGRGFRSPRQCAGAPSGRAFQRRGRAGARHSGDGSSTPAPWAHGTGLQHTGYLGTERQVRTSEWEQILKKISNK